MLSEERRRSITCSHADSIARSGGRTFAIAANMKSNSSGNASPSSILSSPIPQRTYLETEPEKVRFFCEQLKVPSHFLPARTYHGQRDSQPTVRYFVDKFPMFLGDASLTPLW